MVFNLIGIGIDLLSLLADALTKYITESMPLKITDDMGKEKYVTLTLTAPHKVDKIKVIGLIIFGDIDETLVNRIEENLITGIARGTNLILETVNKKYAEDGYYEHKEFKMGSNQIIYPEIKEFGTEIAELVYKDKEIRAKIKQVVKLKNMKWNTESDKMLANIKAEKFQGEYVIKYWEKGLFGETDWVIPYEVIKFWQKVYPFTDPDTNDIAKEIYDSYQLLKINDTWDNSGKFKDAQKLMKQYIKDKSKKEKEERKKKK
ncbi:MAG: hypothetical protein ACTSXA_05140 [Candidatus Heimdallarchaeota archaeon]